MKNLNDATLDLLAQSLEADAVNPTFTAEARKGAATMAKRYRRELTSRRLQAYYGPLPTHYACGTPTNAK